MGERARENNGREAIRQPRKFGKSEKREVRGKEKGESEPLRSRDDQAPRELAMSSLSRSSQRVGHPPLIRPPVLSLRLPPPGPRLARAVGIGSPVFDSANREGLRSTRGPSGPRWIPRRASEGTALPSLPPIEETTFVVRLSAADRGDHVRQTPRPRGPRGSSLNLPSK